MYFLNSKSLEICMELLWTKSCHNAIFFFNDCITSCHNDNIWCYQWKQSWHHDNSQSSVFNCVFLLHGLITVHFTHILQFYFTGLTLIPAWISNHMPSKVWDEINYPFPNFKEVWEWISNFIPHFIMDVITYPSWDLNKSMLVQPGLILGLCPANERRCYKVTRSLIGWEQT